MLTAAAMAALFAGSAQAAVVMTTQPGSASYAGPAPLWDFDSAATTPAGLWGTSNVVIGSNGDQAQPLGSTGNYLSVGPTAGSPVTVNLPSFAKGIASISFIWGSVDGYNTLNVLGTGYSFGGGMIPPANGDRTLAQSNPLVTLKFSGADRTNVTGLQFVSSSNAFEVDNISIAAVPEPTTWAMMIGGFGLIGAALRRRTRTALA